MRQKSQPSPRALPDQMLKLLAEVWELSPDVRLGQLMAHLGFLGEAHLGRSLGYIDDEELLSVLYRHRDELLARVACAPPVLGASASAASTPQPQS